MSVIPSSQGTNVGNVQNSGGTQNNSIPHLRAPTGSTIFRNFQMVATKNKSHGSFVSAHDQHHISH